MQDLSAKEKQIIKVVRVNVCKVCVCVRLCVCECDKKQCA